MRETTDVGLGAPRSDGARRLGIVLAGLAAAISGVSVFVNGEGVKRFPDATVYTTTKNVVAVVLLVGVLALATSARPSSVRLARRPTRREVVALLFVGVVGGGVAFILFFEGLSGASATHAAFLQKTLVVWVALLALPFLHERLTGLHVAAIALLVAGQAALDHGISGFQAGSAAALILGATLLWAVEVIVAKRLLRTIPSVTLGVARLGIGLLVLVGWLLVTGRAPALADLDGAGWAWAGVTGFLLAAYVATWLSALARAQAIDVTAVLVGGAVVTALLDAVAHGKPLAPDMTGLLLVAAGSAMVAVAALRSRGPSPQLA